jgi:Tfp pilus assembly protein PilF
VLASGSAPYEAIVLKASQFLDQGRFIQARHQFQRALRIRTEDPQPWIGVARSYLSSCDEDELEYAHQAAERACNLSNYRDCNALRVLIHSCKSLRRDSDVELYQTHLHELELEEGLNPESIKDLERQIELLQYIG